MKASVRLGHELLAVEGEHTVHAMLELEAPPGDQEGRQPLHLALVIDRSGSMAGAKLEHTKAAADYLVRQLRPSDGFALITFDHEIELLRSMGPVDRDAIRGAIRGIAPGGSTNLSGGWLKGLEEARRAPAGSTRKVLLLTDGLANHGITDAATLLSIGRRSFDEGVGTSTIGYGADFNEELLTGVANESGGSAYFAESPESAPKIFAEEFENLATLVAQNVSVEIRPADEVKVLGILNDYPAVGVIGGVQLNLGDAYAEENRRVVFELHIPEMVQLGVRRVAEIVLRYTSVGDEIAAHEVTLPIVVNAVSAAEASAAAADDSVLEEVLILKSAEAAKEARKRADRGDFEGARTLLQTSAADLRSIASRSARAEELLREADMLDGHSARSVAGSWNAGSSKAMHYDQFRKLRGRRRPPREGEQSDSD